jgi:DNA-binding transcriptional regulator YiaG
VPTWKEAMHLRTQLPPPEQRRAIRRAAGLTLAHLADEVGVSVAAVRLWEMGARFPSGDHLKAYVELLAAIQRRLVGVTDA